MKSESQSSRSNTMRSQSPVGRAWAGEGDVQQMVTALCFYCDKKVHTKLIEKKGVIYTCPHCHKDITGKESKVEVKEQCFCIPCCFPI
mmetsp:Transcript_39155/g.61029  ORF Transcript_39155/g.61029 Transcript_39155/m.61029 type:complete len:88 (+) Transcript_39155:134-397(+)